MIQSINFMEGEWQCLSPFSAHPVLIDGTEYKTAEHAYQALRMLPEARKEIIAVETPLEAWETAQRLKQSGMLLPNHDKLVLMENIFRSKLVQHQVVRDVLESTGQRLLIKKHPTDTYWGIVPDGSGDNVMGKLWMKLRSELQ